MRLWLQPVVKVQSSRPTNTQAASCHEHQPYGYLALCIDMKSRAAALQGEPVHQTWEYVLLYTDTASHVVVSLKLAPWRRSQQQ